VNVKPQRDFCTQACLSGLKRGRPLDEDFPNVPLHSHQGVKAGSGVGSGEHAISWADFQRRIRYQIENSACDYCVEMGNGLHGVTGVLFKAELATFGYAFVGKDVDSKHLESLRRKAAVYERLGSLQERDIPVSLGMATTPGPWGYPTWAGIIRHMMLMS
jgi:hypothetical protein